MPALQYAMWHHDHCHPASVHWQQQDISLYTVSVMSHLATLSRNFDSCVKFAGVTWHVSELSNSFPECSAECPYHTDDKVASLSCATKSPGVTSH